LLHLNAHYLHNGIYLTPLIYFSHVGNMHTLRDITIFVIFASISKNRKHLSRYRLRNDLYCVEWGVKLYSLTRYRFNPPGDSSLSPGGDSCLPPPGWVSDPGV